MPGAQTVPRAELWGAIILMSRSHSNNATRMAIDAAYVVKGAFNEERLVKGKNGDL